MTHDEFVDLLDSVYAPNGAGAQWIKVEATRSRHSGKRFGPVRPPIRAERRNEQSRFRAIGPLSSSLSPNDEFPLRRSQDRHRSRSFRRKLGQNGGTLVPNRKLDSRDRRGSDFARRPNSRSPTPEPWSKSDLGSIELPVRSQLFVPTNSSCRPRLHFASEALTNAFSSYSGPDDPNREDSIPWEAERLFYRVDEIHARAEIVNEKIKPDLVLCLHFNAEPWGDPAHPVLVSVNHLHLLINGAYSSGELGFDDERFAMLLKLLNRDLSGRVGLLRIRG